MEQNKEQVSPEKEKVEIKLKEVEIEQKKQDLKASATIDQLEIERRTLENARLRTASIDDVDCLLGVLRASCIDNSKSMPGSEPVYMSVWDEIELGIIKNLLLQKAKKI